MIRVGAIAGQLGRGLALLLIRVYRAALSPLLGPACRFEPSCSAYAEEAIGRFGLRKGIRLALHRVLRCHPFAAAGFDPVPASISKPSRTETT
jgi:putative membrane protein insertion efficiency factor